MGRVLSLVAMLSCCHAVSLLRSTPPSGGSGWVRSLTGWSEGQLFVNMLMALTETGLPSQGCLQKYSPGPKRLAFLQPSAHGRVHEHTHHTTQIPHGMCLAGVV